MWQSGEAVRQGGRRAIWVVTDCCSGVGGGGDPVHRGLWARLRRAPRTPRRPYMKEASCEGCRCQHWGGCHRDRSSACELWGLRGSFAGCEYGCTTAMKMSDVVLAESRFKTMLMLYWLEKSWKNCCPVPLLQVECFVNICAIENFCHAPFCQLPLIQCIYLCILNT